MKTLEDELKTEFRGGTNRNLRSDEERILVIANAEGAGVPNLDIFRWKPPGEKPNSPVRKRFILIGDVIIPLRSEEKKEIFHAEQAAHIRAVVRQFAGTVFKSFISGLTAEPLQCASILLVIATSQDEPTSIDARDKACFGVKVFADIRVNRLK